MPSRTRQDAKLHRTFRAAAEVLEKLEAHAREAGISASALVERYVDEGLRRDEHPLIVFREAAAGRRPALVGTRLGVWQVMETVKNSGNSTREAADYLHLSEAQVRACVRYYALYQDEVDGWAELQHAIAEREQEAWEREQAVLA